MILRARRKQCLEGTKEKKNLNSSFKDRALVAWLPSCFPPLDIFRTCQSRSTPLTPPLPISAQIFPFAKRSLFSSPGKVWIPFLRRRKNMVPLPVSFCVACPSIYRLSYSSEGGFFPFLGKKLLLAQRCRLAWEGGGDPLPHSTSGDMPKCAASDSYYGVFSVRNIPATHTSFSFVVSPLVMETRI